VVYVLGCLLASALLTAPLLVMYNLWGGVLLRSTSGAGINSTTFEGNVAYTGGAVLEQHFHLCLHV
jgi:hypothetical protein